MRVLIVYRHFWPDSPPYASMLRSIAKRLVADGHEVTVWAESPCYKQTDLSIDVPRLENLDGIKVERFASLPGSRTIGSIRTSGKALFPLRALARGLWRKLKGEQFDLVWTATIPPVVQGTAGRWLARIFSSKFLYHCQDLYPELAVHMKIWRTGGLGTRILRRLEAKNRASADLLVTLSDDMANTARELSAPKGELVVINNFMLEDFNEDGSGSSTDIAPSETGNSKKDRNIRLIFAGNMGAFQGLDRLVEAMRLLEAEKLCLELVMMGTGKALAELKRRATGLENVIFKPHSEFEYAKSIIRAADLGVVALEPGIQRFAFPSKTLTYLGLGLPIFLICEEGSELAGLINDNAIGFACSSPDVEAIAESLRNVSAGRAELPVMREHAAQLYAREFVLGKVLSRWSRLIEQIEPDRDC